MSPITDEQMAFFKDQGYLMVRGLLDQEEVLDPVIEEYGTVLDHLAEELYLAGKIESKYEDLPFGERITKVWGESGMVHQQYFDFTLPQGNIKEDTPFWCGPAVFDVLTNPRLLDAVEAFIGPEIYSNPVQHVRIKLPEHLTPINPSTGRIQLGISPWHQDNGVVTKEADDTDMLTVWFSLKEATAEQGCLTVIPESHREGLLHHCPDIWGLEIPEKVKDRSAAVPQPTRPGDVLFLHKHTCHSSLPNKSNEIRWSYDLRYNPVGQASGRGAFPGFVARSRANPERVLTDPVAWNQMWLDARDALAGLPNPSFNRWSRDHELCA